MLHPESLRRYSEIDYDRIRLFPRMEIVDSKSMNSNLSLLLSLFAHILLGSILYFSLERQDLRTDLIRFHWSKGQIPALSFLLPKARGEGEAVQENHALAGTPEAEIERFKNEIHFPPEALEQRLESDCSWELEIGKNGIARKIKTIRKCKYPLFETHFKKSVSSWKFELPEGKIITIPVSFHIESND